MNKIIKKIFSGGILAILLSLPNISHAQITPPTPSGGSSTPLVTNPLTVTNIVASGTAASSFAGAVSAPSVNSQFVITNSFTPSNCAASSTATTFQSCELAIAQSQVGIASSTKITIIANIPASSWTDSLITRVPGVIVSIQCLPGVSLTYGGPSADPALIFNEGNPTGHIVSDDSGCIYQGKNTLVVAGQTNTATTTGIYFGGDLGAVGINFHDNTINGFGTDMTIGANAYMLTITHNSISGGNGGQTATGSLVMILPASNSGERNVFDGNNFTDPGNSSSTNAIYISNTATASNFFTNNSIDDAQIHVGTSDGQVVISFNHIENPDHGQFGPYIPIQGVSSDRSTMITLIGNIFANDGSTDGFTTSLIQHGGQLYAAGNTEENYGGGTTATFSDHSLDNGVESEIICQTQAQGGTLTSIIGGGGSLAYSLATGASCAADNANSYPIGMNANSSNLNDIYSGNSNIATFDHLGNWTLGIPGVSGSLVAANTVTAQVFGASSTTGTSTFQGFLTVAKNVGIGTTSPAVPLSVIGDIIGSLDAYFANTVSIGANNFTTFPLSVTKSASGVQTMGYFQNLDGALNDGVQICFDDRASLGDLSIGSCFESLRTNLVNSGDSDFIIKTSSSTSMNEVARFTSKGFLGIGTTTPGTTLTVAGTTTTSGVVVSAAVPDFGTGGSTAIACYLSTGALGHISITSLLASGSCIAN